MNDFININYYIIDYIWIYIMITININDFVKINDYIFLF